MTLVSNPRRPVAVLGYVDPKDNKRLLDAVKSSRMPSTVPVFVGNYGINAGTSQQVHALANGRYAPLFSLDETSGRYKGRHDLTKAEQQTLATRPDARFSGPVPARTQLAALSPSDRVRWGMELGKRMRDSFREATRKGTKVDAWQFDEVLGEAGQSANKPLRQFIRGVVGGLYSGRPLLGDKPMRGLTWFAHTALPLAGQKMDGEKRRFWSTIDKASLRVIGEEYPSFAGDPVAAARAWNDGQELMAKSKEPVLRSLARKFCSGLTPGYALGVGLGGNVNGMSRAAVNRWRDAYIAERRREGVAGFAEFDFRDHNRDANVFEDAVKAVAKGVRR
jgi:hypothetical protein